MGPPMHWPIIAATLRRIILRHFALRVHPESVNDNERAA